MVLNFNVVSSRTLRSIFRECNVVGIRLPLKQGSVSVKPAGSYFLVASL